MAQGYKLSGFLCNIKHINRTFFPNSERSLIKFVRQDISVSVDN